MDNDTLDELFANIAPNSPLAAEMEALLKEGIAVDEEALAAATDAVMTRRPRKKLSWWPLGVIGLVAAPAMAFFALNSGYFQSPPEGEEVPGADSSAPALETVDVTTVVPGSDLPKGIPLQPVEETERSEGPWSMEDLDRTKRYLRLRMDLLDGKDCLQEEYVKEGLLYLDMAEKIVASSDVTMIPEIQELIESFYDGPMAESEKQCTTLHTASDESLLYATGFSYYQSGQTFRAQVMFEQITTLYPTSPEAPLAANLMLDSYAKEGNWKALERTALKFYENDQLGDAEFEDNMINIAARASMKQIEVGAQNTEEAADDWVDLYDRYGDVHGVKEHTVRALREAGRDDEADELEAD